MVKYTVSEARQNFASVLNRAQEDGEVIIQRKDGSSYILKPCQVTNSPLDIEGVDLDMTSEEILDIIQEMRAR